MAYEKNTWEDRSAQYPRRYRMIRDENDPDLVTMIPEPGNVIIEGTGITANLMNHMEEGIEMGVTGAKSASDAANAAQSAADTAQSTANDAKSTASKGVEDASAAMAEAKKKIPTVNGATEGHVPVFDGSGNLKSSGKRFDNFTRATMSLSGTTLTITTVV